MPKQVASRADVRHAPLASPSPTSTAREFLLVLGANPLVSNGSLFTAPDMPGRLRALRERGGRLVVVDPRRTRTARAADEHLADPAGRRRATCWSAMAHVLFAEGLVALGRLAEHVSGVDEVARAVAPFPPEAVARRAAASPAATIRGSPASWPPRRSRRRVRADRHLHHARSARSRAGWSTCSTCSPATSTGRAARMFPLAAAGAANTAGTPGRGRGFGSGAGAAACAGCPRCSASCRWPRWPRRSTRPGDGQVRALVTVAGNPVLSTPDGDRLDAALGGAGLHGQRRPLPQRDHPARRRRSCRAPVAAASAALRPGVLPARGPQRRAAARRRCSRRADRPDEWRDPAAARRDRRAGTDAGGARRPGGPRAAAAAVADPARRCTAATPPTCWPRSAAVAAPTGCSTCMLRAGPYGDGFGGPRRPAA